MALLSTTDRVRVGMRKFKNGLPEAAGHPRRPRRPARLLRPRAGLDAAHAAALQEGDHPAAGRGHLRHRRARRHRRHRRRHRLPVLLHRHRGRPAGLRRARTSSAPSAFTGFLSAYFNTREIAPLVAGLALSATVGCGFTAQIGAMRINEEIDALEVMGVPSLPFLVTTRIIAGFIAVIPLYVLGLLTSYFATRTDRHPGLRPVDRHLRPLLQPVPAAAGRALVVPQGAASSRS